MKTNLFNSTGDYTAPECKAVELASEGVLCGSNYGDQGKAGAQGDFIAPSSSESDF